jgi:hypothetical protein
MDGIKNIKTIIWNGILRPQIHIHVYYVYPLLEKGRKKYVLIKFFFDDKWDYVATNVTW